MTLSMVLVVAFWVIAGVIASELLGRSLGIAGHFLGFVLGFLGASVLWWAILRLGRRVVEWERKSKTG